MIDGPIVSKIPISFRAYNNHLEVVKYLYSKGAQINARRLEDDTTPLYNAAQNGHDEVVEYLLSIGADVNASHRDRRTPLWMSSQSWLSFFFSSLNLFLNLDGHLRVCEILIQYGADLNTCRIEDRISPLAIASQEGKFDVVRLLVEKGANVNQSCADGATALFSACYFQQTNIIEYLLKHGADPNACTSTGGSVLIVSSYHGYTQIAEALLKFGANPFHTFNNQNAQYWALRQNHRETAAVLAKYMIQK